MAPKISILPPLILSEWRHPSSVTIHRSRMDGFNEFEIALREWARRFLRYNSIRAFAPSEISEQIVELHNHYNDRVASQYSILESSDCTDLRISLFNENTLIGQIGGIMPNDLGVVFIPSEDIQSSWNSLQNIASELIEAGYPGCVGCGGSDASEPWDELASRNRISKLNVR